MLAKVIALCFDEKLRAKFADSAELVHILWEMAEDAWDNAVDVQSRIEEISKGKPIGRVSKPILEQMLESRKNEM